VTGIADPTLSEVSLVSWMMKRMLLIMKNWRRWVEMAAWSVWELLMVTDVSLVVVEDLKGARGNYDPW